MARKVNRTKKKDEIFFLTLSATGSVIKACSESGYSKTAVYRYRETDKEFDHQWSVSVKRVVDVLEDSALDLAINGEVELKSLRYTDSDGKDKSKIVPHRRRSVTALRILMVALNPEKYSEAYRIKLEFASREINEEEEHKRWHSLTDEERAAEEYEGDLELLELLEFNYPGITEFARNSKRD